MASRARVLAPCMTRTFAQHAAQEAVRPLSEVPGPATYPVIGSAPSLVRGKTFNGRMHEHFLSLYRKYGPIYKLDMAGHTFVGLHDPDDIQVVLRREGKWPERQEVLPWTMATDDIGEVRGLTLSTGEQWQRMRSSVNKHMMRPRSVASHTDDFRQVAEDMVARLAESRDSEHVFPNIRDELFKWSFESACTMLLETRLGLLREEVPPDSLDFINTVYDIVVRTEKLLLFPPQVAKALHLPMWSTYTELWRNAYRLCRKYVDEVLEDIVTKQEAGETPEGLIASMLSAENLTKRELYATMLALMGAAIDTTSNTTGFVLDHLSRDPEIQEKLYQEISSVTGNDQLQYDHIQYMPYMKAVVKETLRLHPVVIMIGRVLEEDIVVRGYDIPAGCVLTVMTYTTGRDPSLFPDPERFHPERWLRGQKEREDISPFASLPFGFGKRACIGRRVVELEIYLMLATVLRRFRLKSTTDEPMETEVRVLLRHTNDPRIQFLDRQ